MSEADATQLCELCGEAAAVVYELNGEPGLCGSCKTAMLLAEQEAIDAELAAIRRVVRAIFATGTVHPADVLEAVQGALTNAPDLWTPAHARRRRAEVAAALDEHRRQLAVG